MTRNRSRARREMSAQVRVLVASHPIETVQQHRMLRNSDNIVRNRKPLRNIILIHICCIKIRAP